MWSVNCIQLSEGHRYWTIFIFWHLFHFLHHRFWLFYLLFIHLYLLAFWLPFLINLSWVEHRQEILITQHFNQTAQTGHFYITTHFFTNLHRTCPTELFKMLSDVISNFSGRDIITSPGLKYFSAINPRPVSTYINKLHKIKRKPKHFQYNNGLSWNWLFSYVKLSLSEVF